MRTGPSSELIHHERSNCVTIMVIVPTHPASFFSTFFFPCATIAHMELMNAPHCWEFEISTDALIAPVPWTYEFGLCEGFYAHGLQKFLAVYRVSGNGLFCLECRAIGDRHRKWPLAVGPRSTSICFMVGWMDRKRRSTQLGACPALFCATQSTTGACRGIEGSRRLHHVGGSPYDCLRIETPYHISVPNAIVVRTKTGADGKANSNRRVWLSLKL
jgi:hypothetical protein